MQLGVVVPVCNPSPQEAEAQGREFTDDTEGAEDTGTGERIGAEAEGGVPAVGH